MPEEKSLSAPIKTGFDSGAAVLREQIKTLPDQPGVYRMLGGDGAPLYVGKAKCLKKRVSSYTQRARLPVRLQRMVSLVKSLEITVTRTESEALLLEANYIQRFLPPFNILLRDDKSYPYILITRDHDFPQMLKHRGPRKHKGWYFGPFASGSAVTETLTLLQRGFMLRNCSNSFFENRSRPCLQYHVKRCTGPCARPVGKEDYAQQVRDAVDFLKGKNQDIQKRLAAQMRLASDAQDYETAAAIRDRIKILTSIQSRQSIHIPCLKDADVMALHQSGGKTAIQVFFYRQGRNYGARLFTPSHDKDQTPADILSAFIAQFYVDKPVPFLILVNLMPADCALLAEALAQKGERDVRIAVPKSGDKKALIQMAERNAQSSLARSLSESKEQKRLLARLSDIFHLAEPPKRIEVYDNSHVQGAYAVGAMIAAGPEGFLKKTYRKFNIRGENAADDFAMMNEVLMRHFKRLIDEDPERTSGMWPDLLLIDGGQGQVNKVCGALNELGIRDIEVVGIAKGPDRNAGLERFFMRDKEPFALPHDDPALYYLQRLRDEAHRFAVGAHRVRRSMAIGVSRLDDIPGIGAKRKKSLLNHFGSAKAVEGASLEDLLRADGINRSTAEKIWNYFRK